MFRSWSWQECTLDWSVVSIFRNWGFIIFFVCFPRFCFATAWKRLTAVKIFKYSNTHLLLGRWKNDPIAMMKNAKVQYRCATISRTVASIFLLSTFASNCETISRVILTFSPWLSTSRRTQPAKQRENRTNSSNTKRYHTPRDSCLKYRRAMYA